MYSKSLAADCCLGWKYFHIKLNDLPPLHAACGAGERGVRVTNGGLRVAQRARQSVPG